MTECNVLVIKEIFKRRIAIKPWFNVLYSEGLSCQRLSTLMTLMSGFNGQLEEQVFHKSVAGSRIVHA